MRAQPVGAVLSISVDLPSGASAGSAEHLFRLFTAAAVPATWFADDPANTGMLCEAVAADIGHEAGLGVESERVRLSGAGSTLKRELQRGRSRLIAGIIERVARARNQGMRISTLAIADAAEVPAELLVKHGISAVCVDTGRAQIGRNGAVGPIPLRYGLCGLSPDFRLTDGGRFAEWRMAMRIRRAIDQCVRDRVPLHLAIDATAIGTNSTIKRIGGVPAILRHVERRREAGAIEVCTIAGLIARLAAPTTIRSAGSILRAA